MNGDQWLAARRGMQGCTFILVDHSFNLYNFPMLVTFLHRHAFKYYGISSNPSVAL
jgi:hypothetical protein